MSKLLALLTLAGAAMAAPIVYVTNFSDPAGFGTVNLGTGVYTTIGSTDVGEITNGPGGGVFGFRENGDWVSVNRSNGATTLIGPSGIAVDEPTRLADGTVYATDLSHNLYTVNTATGATTLVGSTGFTNPAGGLYFVILLGGETDTLYAIAASVNAGDFSPIDHARLFRLNRLTGSATFVADVGNDAITCGLLLSGTEYIFDAFGGISSLDLATGALAPLFDLSASVGGFHGVAAAPEPAGIVLSGLGLLALGLTRLRQR